MEFEFDKEIDSLLRQTAKGESVQTFDAHIDADEISLFAENALTTKARARAVEHLADCAKCRKILSNVISFNAEAESEIIHAEESGVISVAPVIPWYRKLFAFPQITFAMGALALVFSGIIAVLMLQTANDSQNTSVARNEEMRETSKGVSGASSDGETQTVETYSANMSNSTSVYPGVMSNSNMTMANRSANTTSANANSTANLALPAVRQSPPTENNEPATSKQENSMVLDGQDSSNTAALNKPSVAGAPIPKDDTKLKTAEELPKENGERKREQDRDVVTQSQIASLPKSVPKKSLSLEKNKAGEARTIGGKTFRQVGGIWFDSAYTSETPIMIRRGSDDYKRLDSGLRSIAENLSGTIVVLWKSKAYRIH